MEKTRENQIKIARTILAQLGEHKFTVMTGAHQMIATESGIRFRLPGNITRNRINLITVTLTPMDTYKMTFEKTRGMNRKIISEIDGLYCDQLQSIFTAETGLDTSL